MKRGLRHSTILCLLSLLCSCSSFYSRHYTKGFFHEDFARRGHKPAREKEKAFNPDDSGSAVASSAPHSSVGSYEGPVPAETKTRLPHSMHPGEPANTERSLTQSFIVRHPIAPGLMKKSLHAVSGKFKASTQGNSTVVTALLYILALVLTLGIIALAIYFLPSILIPSAVSSTFMSAILIAAVIVLILFAALIYTIIRKLIDLFRPRKESDDF